ncbi:hypothetical protein TWF173_004590 [Orbilia oligospora]|nr:hypothetical protein TWF173_004590 [Orbilia oligospora]
MSLRLRGSGKYHRLSDRNGGGFGGNSGQKALSIAKEDEDEDEEIVERLLKKGVRPIAGLLPWAALKGHLSIVKALIEAGADLEASNNYGYTPLVTSAQHYYGAVEFLLEWGAYIETKNKCDKTLLFMAAQKGKAEIIGLLI